MPGTPTCSPLSMKAFSEKSLRFTDGEEEHADVVVGEEVATNVLVLVVGPGRVVEVQAHSVADEAVLLGVDTVHVLESDAVAARAVVLGHDVVAEGRYRGRT